MQQLADLTDLVDGINLSEEWGEEHLDLDRTKNVDYARRKSEIRATIPKTPVSELIELNDYPMPLRPWWERIVRNKKRGNGRQRLL